MIPWADRVRMPSRHHQVVGVNRIVEKVYFALLDEMGAGKTKQAIDAACVLFVMGLIDRVIVVCPAPVRYVWYDPELGELAKHLWNDVPSLVTEFHARVRQWKHGPEGDKRLRWVVTNYDFIRNPDRLAKLHSLCGPKTMLIGDESSAVKNHKAQQTKAFMRMRQACGRVLLLNGTPIANSPLDMYSQGNIMHPSILSGSTKPMSFFHFRSKYALMGGYMMKNIVGWQNLDDLQRRFAPYVLRRLKVDCLDLPPKLPPVTLTATLSAETWSVYKEMRDELVAWLDNQTVSVAPQAIVKTLRLAQLTSGFLGGLQHDELENVADDPPERPDWLPFPSVSKAGTPPDRHLSVSKTLSGEGQGFPIAPPPMGLETSQIREVSREKLDVFLDWLGDQLIADNELKLLVWCRFRPEVERLYHELTKLQAKHPALMLGRIWGGQKPAERNEAMQLLDPRTSPQYNSVVVIGTVGTGAMGLNLSACHTVFYMSNDYALWKRQQSEDRVHRPPQTYPISYFDVIAVGPQGQKTIDHAIIKALRSKEETANWTTQAWVKALKEE